MIAPPPIKPLPKIPTHPQKSLWADIKIQPIKKAITSSDYKLPLVELVLCLISLCIERFTACVLLAYTRVFSYTTSLPNMNPIIFETAKYSPVISLPPLPLLLS